MAIGQIKARPERAEELLYGAISVWRVGPHRPDEPAIQVLVKILVVRNAQVNIVHAMLEYRVRGNDGNRDPRALPRGDGNLLRRSREKRHALAFDGNRVNRVAAAA